MLSPFSAVTNLLPTLWVCNSYELASFPVISSPLPRESSSDSAGGSSVEITLLEVDAAVAARDARLIGRV